MGKEVTFDTLIGKTIERVDGAEAGAGVIVFGCSDGTSYRMTHNQDCCENVEVNEVVGDVADLIGSPILGAEESESEATTDEAGDSGTWTFYHLRTVKGAVTLRWLGTSNGYYSESVDFEELED